MNILRIFRYSIRIAAWATPHVQRWVRNRNINATEAERHFQARNRAHEHLHHAARLLERHPGYLAPVLEKFARLYETLGRGWRRVGSAETGRGFPVHTTAIR